MRATGVFKENPRWRKQSKQINVTAKAGAIHPTRENGKMRAIPPSTRTAAAIHLNARPKFVNRTLAAQASEILRYAAAKLGEPTVPPIRMKLCPGSASI